MSLGLIGRKCGMTRIFQEDGSAVPVSVIKIEPNKVVQVKNEETDGYRAVQVTTGSVKRSRLTKSQAGHFGKVGVDAGDTVMEFRLAEADPMLDTGSEISAELFEEGQFVDVSGVSIGKGFAGVVKRYNFRTQDATHGNSLSHRAPGSIGQNQTPGRVFKGKKMSGHMGAEKVTIQNLKITAINKDLNLIMIKGAVPGPKGSRVVIRASVKK
jgi:large subunit ribosomal protein L3